MAKRGRPAKKKKVGRPPPTCKAILLSDLAIVEAGTGKASIIGIHDCFYVAQFPGRTSPSTVFLQLTNGEGKYEIRVEILDLKDDKIIAKAHGVVIEFPPPERLSRVNMVIPIPPLPVQHEGKYDVVVLCNDGEIDRQQFQVVVPQEQAHGNDPTE